MSGAQTALLPAVILLLHVPIGLAVYRNPAWATAHAALVILVGLIWATHGTRRPDRVAYAAAYIVGAEVLWRMAKANIAWEFGKYGVIGLLGVWMLQSGRLRGPALSSVYFGLMLPSAALTFLAIDLVEARQLISFNLSGPFATMVAIWFFAQVRFSSQQRQNLYVAALAPIVGIAAITFMATVLNPDIAFGTESNMEASGGFGPNQVSAILGLGALLALLAVAEDAASWMFKPTMLACLLILAAQSALTFSRGGLLNAACAAVAGSLYVLRDARTRMRAIVAGGVLLVLGYYVLFPALDAFTGGALSSRFGDTGVTNRDTIGMADLQIWQEHLVLGVGPGRGNEFREEYVRNAAAHTEYTRMLAEHGLLGLASLIALGALMVQVVRQPRSLRERAVMVSMLVWSFLFMLSYGMRLAAPSFVLGLACVPTSAYALAARVRSRPWRRGVMSHGRAGTIGRAEALRRQRA